MFLLYKTYRNSASVLLDEIHFVLKFLWQMPIRDLVVRFTLNKLGFKMIINLNEYKASKAQVEQPVETRPRRQKRRGRYELKEQDKNYVSSGCRWFPRLQIYKGAHFTFDPKTELAHSYRWWCMARRIDGFFVVNDFHYSIQTAKDFSRLYNCMRREGIETQIRIHAPLGLERLDSAVDYYEKQIAELESLLVKPKTHKRKNAERKLLIKRHTVSLALVHRLIKADNKASRKAVSK